MMIELLLNNSELRQIYVDKETTASDLFDKICKDEKLNQSFYALNYMAPPYSPVPFDCQVANLDSYKLRLVDTKGWKFISFLNSDHLKSIADCYRPLCSKACTRLYIIRFSLSLLPLSCIGTIVLFGMGSHY